MPDQKTVERLLADPSAPVRADLASRIGIQLNSRRINERERALAIDIARRLARDAIETVRVALAESLQGSDALPRDIAITLAKDVEAVALSVIRNSTVFTDDDLLELLQQGSEPKQEAIAERREVSERVAAGVAEVGSERAVAALMRNPGADVPQDAMNRAIDRFPSSEIVAEPMIARARLPLAIAERLVLVISDRLKEQLVAKHALSPDSATDLVLQVRERSILSLASEEPSQAVLMRLVEQLQAGGRLSASLLLRSVCLGDVDFFEMGLAQLAGMPLAEVRDGLYRDRDGHLLRVLARAGLTRLHKPIKVALEVAEQTPLDDHDGDWDRRRVRMIERIVTQFEGIDADDLSYLLEFVRRPNERRGRRSGAADGLH